MSTIANLDIKPPFVPHYEPTDITTIPSIATTIHGTFKAHTTRPIEWRLVQLRRLYWALVDLQPLVVDALRRDMRKAPYEAVLHELVMLWDDCALAIQHLKRWARDESIPEVPWTLRVFGHRVRKDPVGPVLIVGTYNYPMLMCIGPLIGAIAAGCTAVIKPSESAPATAAAMAYIVQERLDRSAFTVVNGDSDHATALLDVGDNPATRWGKILFTGSFAVARIIARRAAETLTPCVFELGGNNPAIVTSKADVALAARRLLWSTVVNSGQICMKQNYVLVERPVVDDFVAALQVAFKTFFPDGAKKSPDYARMIDDRQFERVKAMLEGTKGQVVLGGETDAEEKYIEPTFVLVDSPEDSVMAHEAFGPLSAILPFDTLDEAISVVNTVCATPLALFTFGSNAENEKVLRETQSGGATVNDSFSHGSFAHAPFGGIGTSGTGSYRGKATFDAFTHRRTIAKVPGWAERIMRMRYMPYRLSEMRFMRAIMAPRIDFDREGRVRNWWVVWLVRATVTAAAAAVAAKLLAGASPGVLGRLLER